MISYNSPQGTPEWLAARAGKISASMFSTARGRLKKTGELDAAARNYAFRTALERIGGMPLDDGVDTYAMKRGREREPKARDLLAQQTGEITTCGFLTTDDERFGCSPDGLIGESGGCEIKCLINPDRIAAVLLRKDLSDFMDQIQGCMWVTGRQWWMFALYLPQLAKANMDLFTIRVERDESFIAGMVKDLTEFDQIVAEHEESLRRNIPMRSQDPF